MRPLHYVVLVLIYHNMCAMSSQKQKKQKNEGGYFLAYGVSVVRLRGYMTEVQYKINLPNFIKSMGVTDVLVSCCSYSVVGGNADNLMNLITQDPDSEIVDHQPEISAQWAAEHPEEAEGETDGETGGE